jgi:hypothetical protein
MIPPSVLAIVLGALPLVAFGLQYAAARREHTTDALLRHHTVSIVDWVFIPLNVLFTILIDWSQKKTLGYALAACAVLNGIAHWLWTRNPGAGGHMVRADGTFLWGGWVHLLYSTVQMALVVAFFLTRKTHPEGAAYAIATGLLILYFLAAGVSGYFINKQHLILTDVIMVSVGIAATVWPYVRSLMVE